jgi:uncharacterized membrane protein/mono/diheme cytochrome c family protein
MFPPPVITYHLPSERRHIMNSWILSAMSVAVWVGLRPEVAIAQPPPAMRDIGAEVRNIFAAKCAVCHGPDLAKPKGRFGYVLDLRRVAGNPEMVIPGRPDESELWELVKRDEMPQKDSPQGALTPKQKDVIQEWIVAGAPEPSTVALDSPPSVQSEPGVSEQMEIASADRILRWLGKFHLLLLHFPIALVLAAGVGELWSVWHRNSIPSESVRFCLWLGALAALPTAVLGWLYAAAGNGVGSPQLLTAHRWLGTTAALWLVITAVCAECDSRRGFRSKSVRLLLLSGILMTALTAHLGGLLDRGEEFFTY